MSGQIVHDKKRGVSVAQATSGQQHVKQKQINAGATITSTHRGNDAWSSGEDSHDGGDEEELHFIVELLFCVV